MWDYYDKYTNQIIGRIMCQDCTVKEYSCECPKITQSIELKDKRRIDI